MSAETTPPPGPGPRVGRAIVGIALVLAGGAWLLQAAGVLDVPWQLVLPVALIVVGAALVVAAQAGRSSGGLIVLGIVLTVVLAVGTLVRVPLVGGVGERIERPRSVEGLEDRYELAVGKLEVDLTELDRDPLLLPGRELAVEVSLGVGDLIVRVPEGWRVTGVARSGAGDVTVFGEERSGLDVESRIRDPGTDGAVALELDLSVGLGSAEVRRG